MPGLTPALDVSCDTLVRGRLGRELAAMYRETLLAPLPPRLQALVDRLEATCHGEREGQKAPPRR